MLLADKKATMTEFHIQTLQLREKELDFFVKFYNSISSIGAFLAGFAFSSLKTSLPPDSDVVILVLFLSLTAASIGFQLCAIMNSCACSVFGPGLFLRGPEGMRSAEKAIDVLQFKSDQTLKYFIMGVACTIMSCMLKSFLLYSTFEGIIVTLVLLAMSFVLNSHARNIFHSLYVPPESAISGKIEQSQVADPTNVRFH